MTPGFNLSDVTAAVNFTMNGTNPPASAVVDVLSTASSAIYTTSTIMSTTTVALNTTEEAFVNPFEDMPIDSSFAWLLCALTGVFLWMIYGSCFHSRVIGYIIGFLLNQYFKQTGLGEFSIGNMFNISS